MVRKLLGRAAVGTRWKVAVLVAVVMSSGLSTLVPGVPSAAATPGYVTLLFGRSQWVSTASCVPLDGAVPLIDVASALRQRGRSATGTVVVDRTAESGLTCFRNYTLQPGWGQLADLRDNYGWNFVSNGITHDDITLMTPEQQQQESCGSLPPLKSHGHSRAWGLFAYGNNKFTSQIQADVVSKCFSYGRTYRGGKNQEAQMASPWLQNTNSINGGKCNDSNLPCYSVTVNGNSRYTSPDYIASLMDVNASEWSVVQMYRFVSGSRLSGTGMQWDCTSADWRRHWTTEAELYCIDDYLSAVDRIPSDVTVTDPAAVGLAWGRDLSGTPDPDPDPDPDSRFLTLQFARMQWQPTTPDCQPLAGSVPMDQIVSQLGGRGLKGTGTVVLDRTEEAHRECFGGQAQHASWADLARLRDQNGWQFVSNGATNGDMTLMTPEQQEAESCGSLSSFESRGHQRAWGLYAYGNNKSTSEIQANVVSRCFASGRTYRGPVTRRSDFVSPFFQNTVSVNGGKCHDSALPCYNFSVPGNTRYASPEWLANLVKVPESAWTVLQTYRFVTGSRPGSTTGLSWDCTSANWRHHWTSRPELYCLSDYLFALDRIPAGVAVTDPATVAEVWGRDLGTPGPQPEKPNIVFVVTDDQRPETLEAMPIVSNLLVNKGVSFSNGYVTNPLCCPSRASFLKGANPHSTGVYQLFGQNGPFGGRFDDSSTAATWLDSAGYRTALMGKYFVDYDGSRAGYVPPGWDEWRAFATGGSGGKSYNYDLSVNGVVRHYGSAPADYSTDVLAAEADTFIRGTASDQPVFLYFSTTTPHEPAIPAARHATAFPDLAPHRPPSFNETDVSDKPSLIRNLPALSSGDINHIDDLRRQQYRSLLSVDEAVGKIVDALADTGRLENTLIVYTSDNGLLWGEHRWGRNVNVSKQVPYEESIRVPYVVRYDPLTTSARTDSRFVLNIDVAPTFAALAGVPAPGAEGKSILPLLSGGAPPWRSDFLVEHATTNIPAYCAVRNQQYLYAQYRTGEEELYDMLADPHQLNNRAAAPGMASTLSALRTRGRQLCFPTPPDFAWVH